MPLRSSKSAAASTAPPSWQTVNLDVGLASDTHSDGDSLALADGLDAYFFDKGSGNVGSSDGTATTLDNAGGQDYTASTNAAPCVIFQAADVLPASHPAALTPLCVVVSCSAVNLASVGHWGLGVCPDNGTPRLKTSNPETGRIRVLNNSDVQAQDLDGGSSIDAVTDTAPSTPALSLAYVREGAQWRCFYKVAAITSAPDPDDIRAEADGWVGVGVLRPANSEDYNADTDWTVVHAAGADGDITWAYGWILYWGTE